MKLYLNKFALKKEKIKWMSLNDVTWGSEKNEWFAIDSIAASLPWRITEAVKIFHKIWSSFNRTKYFSSTLCFNIYLDAEKQFFSKVQFYKKNRLILSRARWGCWSSRGGWDLLGSARLWPGWNGGQRPVVLKLDEREFGLLGLLVDLKVLSVITELTKHSQNVCNLVINYI